MTDCPYAHECNKNDSCFCDSCRHKRGKKDHYDPIKPYNPYDPKPYKPWIWPERFEPIFINWKWETNETENRLGPGPGPMLGPKPGLKLKTPYFLS